MRASVLILGPLLARFGKAKISLPGGCAIGTRPIDIHLEGLKKLGANFTVENGYVVGKVNNQLIGNHIKLSFPSVGATENIMMAAVRAKGKTIIENAAMEPEIADLAYSLNKMGSTLFVFIGLDSLTRFDIQAFLEKTKKLHVPIASFLGAIPGCGGAIIVVTQYIQGRISFGALVGVLTATMIYFLKK